MTAKFTKYNPEIHHRKSIRLKTHDYSGGGLYFVTICAHREYINATNDKPFDAPSTRALIKERMQITEEKCPSMHWEESVIMPDHFHALIRIQPGGKVSLGNVVGGFKSAVSRHIHMRMDPVGARACPAQISSARACPAQTERARQAVAPTVPIRIWHRNYYEMIVRTKDAENNIRRYIRMNPWRCLQNFGNGMRGIGNPQLLNMDKIGLACSRKCPTNILDSARKRALAGRKNHCIISGFHSPPEKKILESLLQSEAKLICCPAWGINTLKIPANWIPALEQNRMLILEMKNTDANLVASEQRNRFVLEQSTKQWLPYITPEGMLSRIASNQQLSAVPPTQTNNTYNKS